MINLNPDLRDLMNMIGSTDQGYSSGQQYAQSIAGGENVPGMIAPGVSYSAARPEGYTQAQLNEENRFYNPGLVPVMPSAPTKGSPLTIENQMPYAPAGVTTPERYLPIIKDQESLKNLADLFNANMPSGTEVSLDPFIDGEPMAIDDLMPNIDYTSDFSDFSRDTTPSVGSSPIDFSFNPFVDSLPYEPVEIDPMPEPVDVPVDPMPTYTIPELPVVSLQDNSTGPVDMPFIPNEPLIPSVSMQDYNDQLIREILDPVSTSLPTSNFGGYDSVRGFLR
tara:strand:- start:807 stop:1643 length:837 start_codon:yes stop_codon:yes gene_type:complete